MGLVLGQLACRVICDTVRADHRMRIGKDIFDVFLRHREVNGGDPALFITKKVQRSVRRRFSGGSTKLRQCLALSLAAIAGNADLQRFPVPMSRLDFRHQPAANRRITQTGQHLFNGAVFHPAGQDDHTQARHKSRVGILVGKDVQPRSAGFRHHRQGQVRLAPVGFAFAFMMRELQRDPGTLRDSEGFLNTFHQRIAFIADMGRIKAPGIPGDCG